MWNINNRKTTEFKIIMWYYKTVFQNKTRKYDLMYIISNKEFRVTNVYLF